MKNVKHFHNFASLKHLYKSNVIKNNNILNRDDTDVLGTVWRSPPRTDNAGYATEQKPFWETVVRNKKKTVRRTVCSPPCYATDLIKHFIRKHYWEPTSRAIKNTFYLTHAIYMFHIQNGHQNGCQTNQFSRKSVN